MIVYSSYDKSLSKSMLNHTINYVTTYYKPRGNAMLSKGHCKIVKRPPGNESISFCFIVVHTYQAIFDSLPEKKVKFNLNLKCFTILLQMIYESNHAATTISSYIQVRNWGKKLCYLLPITEENCSEEKSRRKKNQTEKDLYSRNLQLK